MPEPIAYANGEFVPESRATISILDHGLLYGDGIFETALAWNGRVFKLDAHVDRGFRSMAAIALSPPVGREEMIELILETLRRNEFDRAYVKWIVTRGSNGSPLLDPEGCEANLIIIARPYIGRLSDDRIAQGIRVKTVGVRRPSGQVLDPRIKSLNYLNLVLAKIEAKAAGVDEALMLDLRGRISEATGTNVFLVNGSRLRTPQHDILAGVTRATVMELAAELGYSVEVGDLELYDAYNAEEIFLCSTAGGLFPVRELDGRSIGSGKPGPVFAKLSQAYQDLIASDRYGTAIRTQAA